MKYFNLLAFAMVLVMNYLANALPLNGKTTGELSAQYPNLFVPAGITFSIWGIIYLLLMVFIVIQLLGSNKAVVVLMGSVFILSCVFNAAWIVAWHYEKTAVSVVIMLGLLVSLVIINMRLAESPGIFLRLAFGVYLGWICIAAIANVTAWLVAVNWGGWGLDARLWTILLIAAGALITIFAMYRLNNPFLALSVVWAFAGIILRHYDQNNMIVLAASGGILLVAWAMTTAWSRMYWF